MSVEDAVTNSDAGPGGGVPETAPRETLLLQEDSLMWREVDGEVIVLDKRSWTYMGINGSGAVLWGELVGGASVGRLVERLRGDYGLSESTASRDVDAFLTMLRGHGLLADDGNRG
jgi:hypothetical protein